MGAQWAQLGLGVFDPSSQKSQSQLRQTGKRGEKRWGVF